MDVNNKIQKLINEYKKIPGISTKLAERLVVYTIENKKDLLNVFSEVENLSKNLKKDKETGLIFLGDSEPNINKNKETLMIIESNKDYLNLVNKTKTTNAIFVLDTNKRDLQNIIKINELIERLLFIIKKYKTKEIIFLLSPSIETELIIRIVKEEIQKSNLDSKIKMTKIAIGMPVGGSIEYGDEKTINESIKKREEI